MNAKELLAAAKAVLHWTFPSGESEHAKMLANYILATVHEDDDELLDDEWAIANLEAITNAVARVQKMQPGNTTKGQIRHLIQAMRGKCE